MKSTTQSIGKLYVERDSHWPFPVGAAAASGFALGRNESAGLAGPSWARLGPPGPSWARLGPLLALQPRFAASARRTMTNVRPLGEFPNARIRQRQTVAPPSVLSLWN